MIIGKPKCNASNEVFPQHPINKSFRLSKSMTILMFMLIFFLIAAIFIHRYFVFFLVFLYPAFVSGTAFIPMVLQESGKANRYQAASYAPIIYLLSFILTLAVSIIIYSMFL